MPLTFADSSVKVIIELLPAVMRQEIGKWHMGLLRKKKKGREGRKEEEKEKGGFPGGPLVKNLPAIQETQVQSLVWEDPTCHVATRFVHHSH